MPPATRVGTVYVKGDVIVLEGGRIKIGEMDLIEYLEDMERTISDLSSQVEALSNVD